MQTVHCTSILMARKRTTFEYICICSYDISNFRTRCDSMRAEAITYSCFELLMRRMLVNFPQGGAMDLHFARMRSLTRVRAPLALPILCIIIFYFYCTTVFVFLYLQIDPILRIVWLCLRASAGMGRALLSAPLSQIACTRDMKSSVLVDALPSVNLPLLCAAPLFTQTR